MIKKALQALSDKDPDIIDYALIYFDRKLRKKERLIWKYRIVSMEPMSLGKLGNLLGITRSRVGQIESTVIRKFRSYIATIGGGRESEQKRLPLPPIVDRPNKKQPVVDFTLELFVEEQIDLDPRITEMIDNNFWDMF